MASNYSACAEGGMHVLLHHWIIKFPMRISLPYNRVTARDVITHRNYFM